MNDKIDSLIGSSNKNKIKSKKDKLKNMKDEYSISPDAYIKTVKSFRKKKEKKKCERIRKEAQRNSHVKTLRDDGSFESPVDVLREAMRLYSVQSKPPCDMALVCSHKSCNHIMNHFQTKSYNRNRLDAPIQDNLNSLKIFGHNISLLKSSYLESGETLLTSSENIPDLISQRFVLIKEFAPGTEVTVKVTGKQCKVINNE